MVMIKQQLLMVGKNATTINKVIRISFHAPDGKLRVMGQSIPEQIQKIRLYVGTVTDITERKQAEDRILKKDYFQKR
jgi:PAS domain-containing protein